ncbi:RluA family pseudouridine synthase [Butyrivibrio proteoclasticus]|uniref:RluA family pseudouridine synthase n=1 Tax=Butyrivibrio proteoclasticus TaxID=43305 RepID=UPI00047CE56B|nr:RluA family pseudouridine synthase [Butyrivibrio proteoclasticus]
MKEINISNNEAGKRLDAFLKSYLPKASGGFIYKMLRKKNIVLNGKKADGKEKLNKGDSIKIFFADETLDKFRGDTAQKVNSFEKGNVLKAVGDLDIIYEDDNVLFVNKPAGLLSQKSTDKDISLNDWLIEYLLSKGDVTSATLETYKPSICNRLDRNTSGLVICAKSLNGARVMNQMLKERTVDKYYRTIVEGKLDSNVTLKGYLSKDEKTNKVSICAKDPGSDDYSYIETLYEPLAYNSNDNLTYLEVKLITGKPHQIRAHLSSISHPIIGDVKYGGSKSFGMKYQLLHSYRLKFPEEMPEGFDALSGKEYKANLPEVFNKYFSK